MGLDWQRSVVTTATAFASGAGNGIRVSVSSNVICVAKRIYGGRRPDN